MERAAAAEEEKKPKFVTLSHLENQFVAGVIEDFSQEALNEYRTLSKIKEKVGSPPFNRRLVQIGLLQQQKKTFTPTGFGLLLFGTEPRIAMQQAGLLGTIHYPDGSVETCDFAGPMVLIPDQVEQWLTDKLPSVIDRSHMKHQQVPIAPFELVREAVVNALVHRNYDIAGAKCHIEVNIDTIIVQSPGEPLPPITLTQLQAFNAPMLSRNPKVQYVFARMSLANERGLGMKTLRTVPEKFGLPLPKYSYQAPYLVLTLFRTQEAVTGTLDKKVRESLNEAEQKGWQWLAMKGKAKSSQYAEALQVENRTARRHLNRFVELSLVKKTGSGPSTGYEII